MTDVERARARPVVSGRFHRPRRTLALLGDDDQTQEHLHWVALGLVYISALAIAISTLLSYQ